jgi:aminoglycoside phosphotransferase (APT) family kinase protein
LELDGPIYDWLGRHALPGRRIVRTETLTGGYSNDNVLLVTDGGERYVLRRYLRHNRCAVEVALGLRLDGIVPVAEVVCADPDGGQAGEPVLLSRFVPGEPLSRALANRPAHVAADLGRAAGEALAAIGRVGFAYPGFFDESLSPTHLEPTAGLAAFVDDKLANGNARDLLSAAERDRLLGIAGAYEPLLAGVAGARQLVHSDYNPKNIMVRGTAVVAVLDWEFAFSSTPLFDVGNMLRFEAGYPPGFAAGFVSGFEHGGGELPPGWRQISAGLDLFALADLLTRPSDSRYFRKAVARIRERLDQCGPEQGNLL